MLNLKSAGTRAVDDDGVALELELEAICGPALDPLEDPDDPEDVPGAGQEELDEFDELEEVDTTTVPFDVDAP